MSVTVILEPLYIQLFLDLKYSGDCIYQTLMTHCIVVLNFRSLCVIFNCNRNSVQNTVD